MSGKVVLASFVGVVGLITWREVKNPDKAAPIPLPAPSRYVGAGVAFALLGLLGDLVDDRIAGVLAVGLLVGMAFRMAQTPSVALGASGGKVPVK